MAIGTAAAIGLGIAGVGSAIGASSSGRAASKAADTSAQVAAQNNALARDIYGQNKAALSPYMQSGIKPNALMAGAMGFGDQPAYRTAFGNFIENSDYAFQFGDGKNRVNSGYAGSGVLQSGAAMKGLEEFRQNLQSGYRGEFNNLLANQQSLGFGAASALAGVGQNYTNTVTANNNSAGTAAANALLVNGANNPFANTLGMIGGGMFGYGSR